MRRPQRLGFTLIEMMITTAVAAIAIAGAFAFASFQVKSYGDQQDVSQMHASARFVFEALVEDIRNAGYATSFYAGVDEGGAFGGLATLVDGGGQQLGVPAIRMADAATSPITGGLDGLGVQPGSDAISILRIAGPPTNLPASGPNQLGIPSTAPINGSYLVDQIQNLRPCAQSLATDPFASHLVLISDMVRQGEPASMLMQIDDIGAVPPFGQAAFTARDAQEYGLDSSTNSGLGISPLGVGPGSIVTCVQLITYWVDNLNRLRMWRSTPNDPSGTAQIVGTGALAGPLPINPATDIVLVEGVADLQIALFMSGMAGVAPGSATPSAWNYAAGAEFSMETEIVETRAVRFSVLLASPRRGDNRADGAPPQLENHITGAGYYDPAYHYRTVTYQADLKNMRLFDMQSSNTRAWFDVRSYPQ
ncbi:MAG: prepilin-type N-terminal cleavage/methylation domain-containing protein [Myxococcota bacterium]